MKSWRKFIPEGTKDRIFDECYIKSKIEEALKKTYLAAGFQEIQSPTVEYYDVFISEDGVWSQQDMHKLFDSSGRILVLRPEMTTPIARIAATKLKETPHPIRLFYTSNVFRVNESYNGHKSEITQSGIEIIGAKGIRADVDAIITGITALENCGLENFKIELGHSEFYKSILSELNIKEDKKTILEKLIINKNFYGLASFMDELECNEQENISLIKEIPKLFGDITVLNKAEKMTKNKNAIESIEELRTLYNLLKDAGYEKYITVELGMIHELNYYTGIIFKGFSFGVGGSLLSGGRYDNLIKKFGEDLCATGFALDVDNVISASQADGIDHSCKTKRVFIYYKKDFKNAYSKALELRKNGIIVELSLIDSKEEAIKYEDSKGFDEILNFG